VLEPPELALDGGAAALYSDRTRLDSRGMSGCRRSALIDRDAGVHSLVGQRHMVALRP
jgi:hypothetical protein